MTRRWQSASRQPLRQPHQRSLALPVAKPTRLRRLSPSPLLLTRLRWPACSMAACGPISQPAWAWPASENDVCDSSAQSKVIPNRWSPAMPRFDGADLPAGDDPGDQRADALEGGVRGRQGTRAAPTRDQRVITLARPPDSQPHLGGVASVKGERSESRSDTKCP